MVSEIKIAEMQRQLAELLAARRAAETELDEQARLFEEEARLQKVTARTAEDD